MNPGVELAEQLEAQIDELIVELTALPEAAFTRRREPDEWSAAEVVGHLTEMMPYWAGVAVQVADAPGTELGRALDDPDRVGPVAAANEIARGEALGRLRAAAHAAAEALRSLDDQGWQATGAHRTAGPMTVEAMVRSLLVEHAAGHVQQALDAAGG